MARTQYTGAIHGVKPGPKPKVMPQSVQMQLIADTTEAGLGLREAYHAVNDFNHENGIENVGLCAVYTAYKRLNPHVSTIEATKQGSHDESSAWA